jgi:hypothetical protein
LLLNDHNLIQLHTYIQNLIYHIFYHLDLSHIHCHHYILFMNILILNKLVHQLNHVYNDLNHFNIHKQD